MIIESAERLTMDEMNAIAGVTYGRITIRNRRSRWGSCSDKRI